MANSSKTASQLKRVARSLIIAMSLLLHCRGEMEYIFNTQNIQYLQEKQNILALKKPPQSIKDQFSVVSCRLRKEDYKKKRKCITFIKDISYTDKPFSSNGNIVVIESDENIRIDRIVKPMNFKYLVSKTGAKKECGSVENTPSREMKSILLIPSSIKNRGEILDQLEKKLARNPPQNETKAVEWIFEFLEAFIGRCIVKTYISCIGDSINDIPRGFKLFNGLLEQTCLNEKSFGKINLKNTPAHRLITRARLFRGEKSCIKLFSLFSTAEERIDSILKKARKSNLIDKDSVESMDSTFEEEAKIISSRIKDNESRYRKIEDLEELIYTCIDDITMYISTINSKKIPFTIEDSFYREEKEENGKRRIKIKAVEDKRIKMEKDTRPWNRTLLGLLYKSTEELLNFDGNLKMLLRIVEKSNGCILQEIETDRKGKYEKYRKLEVLGKIYEDKVKPIKKLLKSQKTILCSSKYNDLKGRILAMQKKKDTVEKITDILATACTSVSGKRKASVFVKEILESIIRKQMGYNSSFIDILKEKKKLTDSILEVPYSQIDDDSSVVVVKQSIQKILDEVIDVLVYMEIERLSCDKHKILKEIAEKDDSLFRGRDLSRIFFSTVEFFVKYYRKIANDQYIESKYKSELMEKAELAKDTIKSMMGALDNQTRSKWIDENTRKESLLGMFRMYEVLSGMRQYRGIMDSYDEIWMNPVCLTVDSSRYGAVNSKPQKAVIRYLERTTGNIVSKEIEYTDANLNAFRDAQTLKEIKKIEGRIL